MLLLIIRDIHATHTRTQTHTIHSIYIIQYTVGIFVIGEAAQGIKIVMFSETIHDQSIIKQTTCALPNFTLDNENFLPLSSVE